MAPFSPPSRGWPLHPPAMHRHLLASATFAVLLVSGCDSGGPDSILGPDEQLIPTECAVSNTVALTVGETREFRGIPARYFCVSTSEEAREDYLLVLFQASAIPLTLSALVTSSIGVGGPPVPAPPAHGISETDLIPLPDHDFHRELRERELRELTPLIQSGSAAPAPARAPASVPSVGQILKLNAQANPNNLENGACEVPLMVDARVEAVSQRAIVAADVLNPSGGFTSADYAAFASAFDTLIAPVAEAHFGTPTNLGGTGRIILLFTREVNRLTPSKAQSFTAGFFFARDLFPRVSSGRFRGCTHSNEAEILYLMVPDPTGSVSGNPTTRGAVFDLTPSTTIHEYQHLINAGRRLHVQQLTGNWAEATWLNEGLSHIAEELLFYAASGLTPGQNIHMFTLGSSTSLQAIALNRYQRFNFQRFFLEFLPSPEVVSPFDASVTLGTRGAGWHFLRYLADRRGGSQPALFRSLIDTQTSGLENLATAVGGQEALFDWMADWRVAIYSDDRVPGLDPRHRDLSWHLPSIRNHVTQPGGGPYPIRTHAVTGGEPLSLSLVGGGAAYLRFGSAPSNTSSIQITSAGGLPPSSMRAILVRTR